MSITKPLSNVACGTTRAKMFAYQRSLASTRSIAKRRQGDLERGRRGGLSGAATDLARLVAVWISPKDTPALKRGTVKAMLDIGLRWYPNFPEVMGIAAKVNCGGADLFPEFGMPALPSA